MRKQVPLVLIALVVLIAGCAPAELLPAQETPPQEQPPVEQPPVEELPVVEEPPVEELPPIAPEENLTEEILPAPEQLCKNNDYYCPWECND